MDPTTILPCFSSGQDIFLLPKINQDLQKKKRKHINADKT